MCSMKISVLKNFAKFTGKHLCQSLLFNKVAGLRPATLLNKRLCHRSFPVNFAKLLQTPASEHCFTHYLIITMKIRASKSKIKSMEILTESIIKYI